MRAKTAIFGLLTLFGAFSCVMATATPAAACGVSVDDEEVPRRDVVLRPVSFDASELFEQAQSLDDQASAQDREASAAGQRAETLENRARILRNQANQVAFSDRGSVLAIADELSTRAAAERSRMARARASASSLRERARLVRARAVELVRTNGGGGRNGWRGTPRPTSASTNI